MPLQATFEFSEESMRQIEGLMKTTGIKTVPEFLNNDLTIFEWSVKQVQAGREIKSIPASDAAVENGAFRRDRKMPLPFFEHLKR